MLGDVLDYVGGDIDAAALARNVQPYASSSASASDARRNSLMCADSVQL
jgi:hypothetical protein